jgi:spore coat polysaccharide biosynthesis predicted glycosyltransferase SpsG
MNTLYFRTRGGYSHGWGHIIRLNDFAQYYLRSYPSTQICFIFEGNDGVREYYKNTDYQVIELPEDISVSEENFILSQHINEQEDLIIMEMLESTYERQVMLKEYFNHLVIFDDLLDHRYCADMVFCGQHLPGYGNSEISHSDSQFFCGPEYFLNRQEFEKYRYSERSFNPAIKKILVSLGGGYYDIAYFKIAEALKDLPNLEIDFIMGFDTLGKIKEEIQSILPNSNFYSKVNNISDFYWNCDLAIIGAGYNKLEAAFTQTPALMIAVQWHQIPLGQTFEQKNNMPFLGYMSYLSPKDIQDQLTKLSTSQARIDLVDEYKHYFDGKGFERVLSTIQPLISV